MVSEFMSACNVIISTPEVRKAQHMEGVQGADRGRLGWQTVFSRTAVLIAESCLILFGRLFFFFLTFFFLVLWAHSWLVEWSQNTSPAKDHSALSSNGVIVSSCNESHPYYNGGKSAEEAHLAEAASSGCSSSGTVSCVRWGWLRAEGFRPRAP